MFSVEIKGNHVQLRNQGNRLNYVTMLAIRIQVMFIKIKVTQKLKGVTY
jgi:hypothetical protein